MKFIILLAFLPMEPTTFCDVCYKTTLPTCVEEIIVDAQLEANTEYTWVIEDKFGRKYSKVETTDGDGLLTISVEDLPVGLFTAFSGSFTLIILNALGETVSFTYDELDYTCIQFSFFEQEGVLEALIPDPSVVVAPPGLVVPSETFIDQTPLLGSTYGLLIGAVDGLNTTFTVSQGKYKSGTLKVHRNGVLSTQGVTWTETTPTSGTFQFAVAPAVGNHISAEYET
jgi:hypothetical protein